MKIFLALSPAQNFVDLFKECNVPNCLVSYAFLKTAKRFKEIFSDYIPKNLIIDSGAFSIWTGRGTIDIDKYADYCLEVKSLAPKTANLRFVNLDVLPGKFGVTPTEQERKESVEGGWANMEYLEKKGLKVIPVFHQHESFDILHKLMNHTDYIGLSPANDVAMNSKLSFLSKCFSITRDKVKTHGFAVTSYDQLIRFPFYSVDSSSWCSGGRFARIPIVKNGKIMSFYFKDKNSFDKCWDFIDEEDKDGVFDDWKVRDRIGIKAFVKFNDFVEKLWLDRGVNYKE